MIFDDFGHTVSSPLSTESLNSGVVWYATYHLNKRRVLEVDYTNAYVEQRELFQGLEVVKPLSRNPNGVKHKES